MTQIRIALSIQGATGVALDLETGKVVNETANYPFKLLVRETKKSPLVTPYLLVLSLTVSDDKIMAIVDHYGLLAKRGDVVPDPLTTDPEIQLCLDTLIGHNQVTPDGRIIELPSGTELPFYGVTDLTPEGEAAFFGPYYSMFVRDNNRRLIAAKYREAELSLNSLTYLNLATNKPLTKIPKGKEVNGKFRIVGTKEELQAAQLRLEGLFNLIITSYPLDLMIGESARHLPAFLTDNDGYLNLSSGRIKQEASALKGPHHQNFRICADQEDIVDQFSQLVLGLIIWFHVGLVNQDRAVNRYWDMMGRHYRTLGGGAGAGAPVPAPAPTRKTTAGPRPKIPKALKDSVWRKRYETTAGLCMVCLSNEVSFSTFHTSHIVAHAEGGPTTIGNLEPACLSCNTTMGDTDMRVFIVTAFGRELPEEGKKWDPVKRVFN